MGWDGLLGGGGQVHIHVQSMWQTRMSGGHAPLGNFDLGLFIRCNLGLFSHKHNLHLLGEKSLSYLMKIAIESLQKLIMI